MQRFISSLTAGLLVASTLAYGQQTVGTQNNGWKRVGDHAYITDEPAQSPDTAAPQAPATTAPQGFPNAPSNQAPYGTPPPNYSGYPTQSGNQAPPPPVPSSLRVPAGTFLTVQTNNTVSSDQNHPGDAFFATLARPVVVDGVVIAEPGQTVTGQVVEAQRAGRIEGTARLRVQLDELTLVDGQQMPIRTQLIGRKGNTSVGRDAGAIAGTTGLGAAIGAAAGWGTGAAIGAGAGAAVGLLGVLLTRGHPSIIYPEETLTFRIEAPFNVDTERSAQAFRYVQPNEYNQPLYTQQQSAPQINNVPPPAPVWGPYYGGGYPWGGYGYPYGPSFSVFVGGGRGWGGPGWGRGPGWYGPGFYRGRGWRRW